MRPACLLLGRRAPAARHKQESLSTFETRSYTECSH